MTCRLEACKEDDISEMLIFKLSNLAIKIEECVEVVSSYSHCWAGKITTKTERNPEDPALSPG